jgi:hypothetical protein
MANDQRRRGLLDMVRAVALVALACLAAAPAAAQKVEKQLVVSIGAAELKGGMVSEIVWDGGLLLVQGVFAEPSGELKADYFLVAADGIEVKRLAKPPEAAVKYWELKSNRVSPTGLGRIDVATDSKLPLYGVSSLDQRLRDAHQMGGMQTMHVLRLGQLVLLERTSDAPPYDGETYSWSPAELNRIAYVDGKGDLWVAFADGTRSRRLARGDFTLPAWSSDGRIVAVAERKDGGRRWDISVFHLPEELRRPLQGR